MSLPGKLHAWLARARKHDFATSVAKLAGGTAGAQLIGLAALPLLTRLYTPGDFKLLAAYTAVVSILSVVSCLRYDFAIPLPKSDVRAANLLVLSLACVCATTLVVTGVIAVVVLMRGVDSTVLGHYVWLVPFGLALAGAYSAAQMWASRKRWYGPIARTRIWQISAGIAVQVVLGAVTKSPGGLLAGHALSGGVGASGLLGKAWKDSSRAIKRVNARSLRSTLRRFGSFPKYSVIDGLSTNAASQLPILLIATWSVGPEAGYLLLATKIIAAPVQMVSAATSQVFLAAAPEKQRQGRLAEFTASVSRNLLLVMSVPMTVFAIAVIPLVEVIFGEDWSRAGSILVWLIPWYAIRLLSAPISMVMNVVGRQKQMMLMKIIALVFRVGAVAAAHVLLGGYMVEALAIASFIVYLVFGVVFLRAAGVTFGMFVRGPKLAGGGR